MMIELLKIDNEIRVIQDGVHLLTYRAVGIKDITSILKRNFKNIKILEV